jgi:predicted acyltransferase
MSTTAEPAAAVSAAPGRVPELKACGRLVSLDAYRGFIMLLLVAEGFGLGVLRNHPGWEWLAYQVNHAAWEGCTFWDLIQPAFTFMVGMAMPFAFSKRLEEGASRWGVFRHVAWRALILIALSNIYSNWGTTRGLRIQLVNVLSQIAFGYMICYWIIQLKFKKQVLAAAAMLGGYWALWAIFPGPEGTWSKVGNIGQVVDQHVLGYTYSGYYTTINFIGNAVTILFGCWAGLLVRTNRTHMEKVKIMVVCGLAGLALGFALQPINPMVKRIWTASFTFFSAGWVVLMLAFFYWVVEVKQARKWTFPFIVLGMNSLFVYSLGQIGIKGWLDRGLRGFTGNFAFLGDLGTIAQHLLVLAGLWYICYWLYRRKIFIKI